ncbi:MAG: hypothetical protein HRU76_14665 [Phycisphaeraceae bacterium]|nr:MAG: hypothetical protein HRU76_14665 [Phycisphaeraceae bacterium]
MAIFGSKKDSNSTVPPSKDVGGNGSAETRDEMSSFVPDPEKARKWFNHARTALDSTNYEYALTCFANGIKFDPEDMAAHTGMYEAAIKLKTKGGKPASGKDVRSIDGPHPVARFAAAEYEWMRDYMNPALGVRLIEAAVKAQQREFGRWLAPKLLNLLRAQKKPSKSHFIAAMRAFGAVGAWDQAIEAGEIAVRIDPADAALAQEIKNLAAQRAMDQGGYEQAGQEGGFRKFVKDSDKQRDLEAAESLSGAGQSDERNYQKAKQLYEENPALPDNINRYALALRKLNVPNADDLAYRVYMKGYQDTREFRFRLAAADIKIAQAERGIRELESKVAASPDDEELRSQLETLRREHLMYKAAEYAEREVQYPTDRMIKYHRGDVEFELGNHEAAMSSYQQAKDEPKLRVPAGHKLGLCFAAVGWHTEAISEFKEALENIDATNRDRELDIRYDLMVSLIAQARTDRSIELAKEALEICSGIARKDITYRDIRARRKEIDDLVKELSA